MRFLIPILAALSVLVFTACEDNMAGLNKKDDGVYGIVRDYTGLDGCGYVIELINGGKLEPVSMSDSAFVLRDNQFVFLRYHPLKNLASVCMVGEMVHIDFITEVACTAITVLPFNFSYDTIAHDAFVIDTAFIRGDCLVVRVGYSGGCRDHQFRMYLLRPWCATPPVSPPILLLSHQSNGDLCEAYITDTLRFDLSILKHDQHGTCHFYLRPFTEQSSYNELFRYDY